MVISLLLTTSTLSAVNADLNPDGSPKGIPGIDFPIIPGVNAPFASSPAGPPGTFILPPGFKPGDPAPLPPPLFNADGTPFVLGSRLDMPVRADGTQLSYEYDSLTGLYLPVTRVSNEPLVPVIINPDGSLFDPTVGAPLPPPLFNPDGTPFITGSKLLMPIRADGTQLSYDYDPVTGLYWPLSANAGSPIVEPAPGVIATTFVYDQISKQMVSVIYRSAQLPPINPDGSINESSKVVIPVVKSDTLLTSLSKQAQIGSWAVVDGKGNVINAIVCSEKVCGKGGDWGGKFIDQVACPDGCQLVLQVPPNPITGQSMGGYMSGESSKVTYKNGSFKVESLVRTPADGRVGVSKPVVRSIKDGVITDITGQKIDLSTGYQLPSVIKDAALKKQVDAAFAEVNIEPVKAGAGYQLTTDDQLPAIDASLKIVAVKKGERAKTLKFTIDKSGELFVATKDDLTGYEIQIKRGAKTLKSVKVA